MITFFFNSTYSSNYSYTTEKMKLFKLIWFLPVFMCFNLLAQSNETEIIPTGGGKLYMQTNGNDTIYLAYLRDLWVYPPYKFVNTKQEKFFWRTVKDVKITLPYAKLIALELNKANQKLALINDNKEKKKFMTDFEKNAFKKYEKDLKKMTVPQGRILMKLIDRECNKTSYELIKAYKGNFTAFFWQGIAKVFGSDLKSEYDSKGNDKIIERVIVLVENRQI